MAHQEIHSPKVFKPTAPMSPATRARGGTLVHISGQVAQSVDGQTVGRGELNGRPSRCSTT